MSFLRDVHKDADYQSADNIDGSRQKLTGSVYGLPIANPCAHKTRGERHDHVAMNMEQQSLK